MPKPSRLLLSIALLAIAIPAALATQDEVDLSPRAEERQLPKKMHSAMRVVPRIKVGHTDADIIGTDDRALQAAVDYIAGLGGGIVEIGPGEFIMRDPSQFISCFLFLAE